MHEAVTQIENYLFGLAMVFECIFRVGVPERVLMFAIKI